VSAWVARRRDRASAPDAAARTEAAWQDLLARVDDLGLRPPTGATPRRVGEWVSRHGYLDESTRQEVDHVVLTVEPARYGRPGTDLPDIRAAVDSIVSAVRQERMATPRIRATLWPRAGVEVWTRLPRRLADRVHRR